MSTELPQLNIISLPAGVHQATGRAYWEVLSYLESVTIHGKLRVVAYIEAPVVGRGIGSTIVQAQVGGAVLAALETSGVETHLVNVSTWKKKVVGKGNAKKEEVSLWLRENWKKAYDAAEEDQDLIDACCLNRFGVANQRLAKAILDRSRRVGKAESKEEARVVRRRQLGSRVS